MQSRDKSVSTSIRLPVDAKEKWVQSSKSMGLNKNQVLVRLIYRFIGYLDPDPKLVDVWKEHLAQIRGGYSNLNQIAKSAKNGTVIWTDDDRAHVEKLYKLMMQQRRDLKDLVLAARQNREPHSAIRRILKEDGDAQA